MRRVVSYLFLFTFLLLFFSFKNISSAQMYAECDQCGYCAPSNGSPTTVPGNWAECAQCMYPDVYPAGSSPDPADKKTLLIDPVLGPTNAYAPPAPKMGRAYTMLGCIKTDLSRGFQSEGAASSIVKVTMDFLLKIAGAISFLYLIYGAFTILTSQSEPEKLSHGKKIFTGAIIGFIFAVSSVFILNFLASGVLNLPGFGS